MTSPSYPRRQRQPNSDRIVNDYPAPIASSRTVSSTTTQFGPNRLRQPPPTLFVIDLPSQPKSIRLVNDYPYHASSFLSVNDKPSPSIPIRQRQAKSFPSNPARQAKSPHPESIFDRPTHFTSCRQRLSRSAQILPSSTTHTAAHPALSVNDIPIHIVTDLPTHARPRRQRQARSYPT
jgi:hypothetical protein